MPRLRHQIEMDADGLYHLRGQVAGPASYYPLHVPENAERLYWTRLYWRGTHSSKENDGRIPLAVEERGRRQIAS